MERSHFVEKAKKPDTYTAQWYVLYTQPRHEKKAEQILRMKGYTTYLPLQTTLKQWSDRKKKVEIPLFSSYVFIKTELERTHIDILNTPGVVKFVTLGKEIAKVREEHIDQIRLLLTQFDELDVVPSTSLQLNQKVEIIAGPFTGMKGILMDHKGTKQFALEIDGLGTNLIIQIPSNYLKPI
ncbi:MAG: UpxY family transcription antiterminator [Bacteroidia bacterium]|jgi:transcription elongation factor/antiterminator RfaH